MIQFLDRLVRQSRRKVQLIVNGHPVQRGAAVRACGNAWPEGIKLFRLPGYAPELNPDELLN